MHMKTQKVDYFWSPFTHTALRMMSSHNATLRHFGLTLLRSYSNGLFNALQKALINQTCLTPLTIFSLYV